MHGNRIVGFYNIAVADDRYCDQIFYCGDNRPVCGPSEPLGCCSGMNGNGIDTAGFGYLCHGNGLVGGFVPAGPDFYGDRYFDCFANGFEDAFRFFRGSHKGCSRPGFYDFFH